MSSPGKEKRGPRALVGLDLEELEKLFQEQGAPRFRAVQVADWMYRKGVETFDEMANLPSALRGKFKEKFLLYTSSVEKIFEGKDKTRKLLIRLHDGSFIESVILIDGSRITLCLSTQVGCPVRCRFCASGKGGFLRNLTAGEIVEEYLHLIRLGGPKATNLVFMGMGEPLLNAEAVFGALRVLNAPWGVSFGSRRMTLSTIGIQEGIERLMEQGIQVTLAISLHAPDDKLRKSLIPYKKMGNLDSLLRLAGEYRRSTGRDVTVEYVLLHRINSSVKHAQALADLLRGQQINVNLIPFNPVQGVEYETPPDKVVEAFQNTLRKNRIVVHVRKSRGRDAAAACGQLALKKQARNSAPPDPS